MVIKKFLYILTAIISFIIGSLYFIYSQNAPIVSIPFPIKSYLNFSNSSSYAVYQLELINPTNISIQYSFSVLSPYWNVVFGQNNQYKYGILPPNKDEIFYIYLRPYELTNQICEIVINYRYLNGTPIISYPIQITPTIYYYEYNITKNINKVLPQIEIKISNTTFYAGQYIKFSIYGYNNNTQPINENISIITSWNYNESFNLTFKPGNNYYYKYIQIPFNLESGYYYIKTLYEGYVSIFNIFVIRPQINLNNTPIIIKKNNEIIIKNPYNYSIEYTYIYNISSNLLSFLIVNPKPSQIEYENGKLEFIYYLYIPPEQEFVITVQYNYILISLLAFIIAIIIVLILFVFFIPVVDVKKKILKYDIKNRTFTVELYIKNKSFLPIYNIRIEDIIPKNVEILNYEVMEPTRVYRDEFTRVIWNIEKIDKNGELIITYTIRTPSKDSSIYLQPFRLRYEFTFRSIEVKSNGLRISMI